jgi:hypothetical protein
MSDNHAAIMLWFSTRDPQPPTRETRCDTERHDAEHWTPNGAHVITNGWPDTTPRR